MLNIAHQKAPRRMADCGAQIRLMLSCRLENESEKYDWISDLQRGGAINHIERTVCILIFR